MMKNYTSDIDQKYEIQRLDSKIKNLEYEYCKLKADHVYPERYSPENKKAREKCFQNRWNLKIDGIYKKNFTFTRK